MSKLQTVLALSADDIAKLPTPATKLRELREENDALRAELRKLHAHSPSSSSSSASSSYLDCLSVAVPAPMQLHTPPADPDAPAPQPLKRRRLSPLAIDDYAAPRTTYLASAFHPAPARPSPESS